MSGIPKLSVVIPVYNEEAVLPTLFSRLYPVLDALNLAYEIVFVNDGSKDRSAALLRQQFSLRPRETRVVLFHANFGQHSAVMAGLAYARGEWVVTLDADLQNPPEEIGKLVGKLGEGYDYVGTIREQRQDSWWRRWFSRRINKLREWITPVRITDQGCMMRGYARSGGDRAFNQTREVNTFIPALASLYAMNPHRSAHRPRGAICGPLEEVFRVQSDPAEFRSNHGILRGAPCTLFSMVGMLISLGSGLLFLVLVVRRLWFGSEAEGFVYPVCLRIRPDRRRAVRHWPVGRVCRAHLRPGARAAALHRCRRSWRGWRGIRADPGADHETHCRAASPETPR